MKIKIIFWTFIFSLLIALGGSFLLSNIRKSNEVYLAVIPHFMIQPKKVDEFYGFIKEKFFREKNPNRIILISPNHFFKDQKKVESVCKKETIFFKNTSLTLSPLGWKDSETIECKGGEFYQMWKNTYTKEHWIWEHFQWITKYFDGIGEVNALIIPTHLMSYAKWISEKIFNLNWVTLVIASVDFSHYKPENIALKNDQHSLKLLQEEWNLVQLSSLDVDCPACLGVVYLLGQRKKIWVHQWYRDSSSSIVGVDLKENNTSRQFLRRE